MEQAQAARNSWHGGWFSRHITKDLVLPIRLPAIIMFGFACYNTHLYNLANTAFDRDSRFGTVRGRLLEINKGNYFYNAVPRYNVRYEYVVDGKRYESRRATTGSFYRNWVPMWLYTDTITESQYLQAYPILRVSEPCTVFYDKRWPGAHSAIAADANSTEGGIALYLAVFPLIFAGRLKTQFLNQYRRWNPPKYRVGVPKWSNPAVPEHEAAMMKQQQKEQQEAASKAAGHLGAGSKGSGSNGNKN